MTELLQKAVAEAEKTGAEVQDAIASLILAELKDEEGWQQTFESTTDNQWDRLAESVRKEIHSGDTEPLDELLR